MEPSTEFKTNTPALVIGFALACAALLPCAQGVTPAPDGGYAGFNTAEGQNALFSRTTGLWNTGLGAFTLYRDTSGNGNTAVGINGLRNNVTGGFNTAVGLNTLYFNNGDPINGTGSENSALGAYALFHNTTGGDNTALGAFALSSSTGFQNTAIGDSALMRAVRGAKGIVHVKIGRLGKRFGEFWIIRFLTWVKPNILEQRDIAILHDVAGRWFVEDRKSVV